MERRKTTSYQMTNVQFTQQYQDIWNASSSTVIMPSLVLPRSLFFFITPFQTICINKHHTWVLTRFWSSMCWARSNGERLWFNWIYWYSVSASTWNLDVRSYCCHPSWSTQGWLGWGSAINTIQLKKPDKLKCELPFTLGICAWTGGLNLII